MRKAKSVLMTTTPAKDGTQFPVTELEKALSQTAASGIVSCLGHDSAKPVAWTIPSTLYLEPGSARLAGITWIPESESEQKQIARLHYKAIAERTDKDFAPYKDLFEEELKGKLSPDYKVLSSTFVSCYDPAILHRCYPSLMAKVDRDGLLYLSDILEVFNYLGQGVFADKNSSFAICAHSYFRRSLFRQNNLNFVFLDALMKYVDTPDVTLRLRLDTNLIGVAKTFIPAMEFEHWRGPHFNDDITAIKLGVTEHKMDEYNKLFNGIGRTEFWWKIESGEQAFEAEEVKEVPSLGISTDDYGCRYAHSIYDTEYKVFQHFDGAIRMYDSDMIMQRWENDIKSAGKQSIYTKLFRVDGKFPLADWKLLLHHYFQSNYLVEEYLTGSDHETAIQPTFVEDHPKPLLESLAPLTMIDADGLRIAVSYLPEENLPAEATGAFFLAGHDTYDRQELKAVVEVDIVEIKKALLRLGQELIIPADYQYLDCDDGREWNIPEIAITDPANVPILIPTLLKSVADVLIAKNNPAQTVTFTFSWSEDNGRRKVISLLGTSKNMVKWLTGIQTIPLEQKEFSTWLTAQQNWLAGYTVNYDEPNLNDVLYTDGALFIKHESIFNYIDPASLNLEAANFSMQLKPEHTELYQLILDRKIAYAQIFHIIKMLCKTCGQNYFTCPHSDALEHTGTDIKDYQIVGFYWLKPEDRRNNHAPIPKNTNDLTGF